MLTPLASAAPPGSDSTGSGGAASERPPASLYELVSPYGVVSSARRNLTPRGMTDVDCFVAPCGGGSPGVPSPSRTGDGGSGCGRTLADSERARLIAIAESAERYSSGDFLGEEVMWARAAELPGAVLDPRRIPRCSERELRNPDCPVRPFDDEASIRWVRGTDLATGEPTWVPAAMACYLLRDVRPEETFNYRISTGYAVHSSPAEAVVQGICEVVERDAIAVAWLQKMPLPLVAEDVSSDRISYMMSWGARHFVDIYLFDATTDVGLPTVFCLQVARYDQRAHQTVGCGTGRTILEATEKALLEAATVRALFTNETPLPASFAGFVKADHGARYMGAPDRLDAFSFLIDGADARPRRSHTPWPDDPSEMLRHLIDAHTALDMQMIVVDRTPRELAAVGLTAVTAVIPDLQPLSLAPLAQFRAHRRLASLPVAMGYPSLTEEEQNWWPHPLA